eukprot:Filipodium_phascolosomae@DN195_c0_g1_i2.p1
MSLHIPRPIRLTECAHSTLTPSDMEPPTDTVLEDAPPMPALKDECDGGYDDDTASNTTSATPKKGERSASPGSTPSDSILMEGGSSSDPAPELDRSKELTAIRAPSSSGSNDDAVDTLQSVQVTESASRSDCSPDDSVNDNQLELNGCCTTVALVSKPICKNAGVPWALNPNEQDGPPGCAFVEFSDVAGAKSAKKAINGRSFGCGVVEAHYFSEEKYFKREFKDPIPNLHNPCEDPNRAEEDSEEEEGALKEED